MRIVCVFFFSLCALQALATSFSERQEVRQWLRQLSVDYQFDQEYLIDLFAQSGTNERILNLISQPAEKTLPWYRYREIFLDQERIRNGVAFMRRNQHWLKLAEERYGVRASVIVAIIGVETRYGKVTGNNQVLNALATLAFDYPPRSDFFTSELIYFLRLSRRENYNPLSVKGSYAGAMGMAQFMPSSYFYDAIDFDGDGVIDLWNSEADAIGSIAHYLLNRDWRKGAAFALRMPDLSAVYPGENRIEPFRSVREWSELGIDFSSYSVDSNEKFGILALQVSEVETAYWLTGHNFYVITRYNTSPMYALAVLELAQLIENYR